MLDRAICRGAPRDQIGADARDVDDHARTLRLEMAPKNIRAADQGVEIDPDHLRDLVQIHRIDRARCHGCRIVDEDVASAERLFGQRKQAFGRLGIGDVGSENGRGRRQARRDRVQKFLATTGNDHASARLAQFKCRGRSDAGRRAGDDRYLVFQVHEVTSDDYACFARKLNINTDSDSLQRTEALHAPASLAWAKATFTQILKRGNISRTVQELNAWWTFTSRCSKSLRPWLTCPMTKHSGCRRRGVTRFSSPVSAGDSRSFAVRLRAWT